MQQQDKEIIFVVVNFLQFSSCCKKIQKNFSVVLKTNGKSPRRPQS